MNDSTASKLDGGKVRSARNTAILHLIKLLLGPLLTIIMAVVLFASLGNDSAWLDVRNWDGVKSLVKSHSAEKGDVAATYSSGEDIYGLLLFVTATLVAFNTVVFYFEVTSTLEDARDNVGRGSRQALRFLLFILIVLNLAWPLDIVAGVPFPDGKHAHEVVVLILFAGFAIIDLLLYKNFQEQGKHYAANRQNQGQADLHLRKLGRDADYYMKQALFVDLPVVISVLVVMISVFYIESSEMSDSPFVNGLVSGSVIMHLAFSQVIFLITCLQLVYREYRDDILRIQLET
ncbi:MAG: hypothetical protein AAGJ38_04845 [Planctomycetota bacterium]